jgi:mannose-6-phosphate isomerase-like protein (cupin superfamily)
MKVVRRTEGDYYGAVDHFNVWSAVKVKEGESVRTTVAWSHFLPDGGAKMKPSARERLYYIISGSITVHGDDAEYVLNPGDSIYIPPNENRSISVNNNEPATMLVVIVRVE